VLRRRLLEAQPQEPAQGQRVRRAPGDAAFRVEALEVADQQQAEVRARRQARAAHAVRIERGALGFHEVVEAVRVEHLVQPLVERMAARRR